jgi:Alpha-(1,6)-fucosyltransferase N- and catalytic domains
MLSLQRHKCSQFVAFVALSAAIALWRTAQRNDSGLAPPFIADNYAALTNESRYDGTCLAFRSSQLHGPITQKRAADIVRKLVSHEVDAQTCPVFFRNHRLEQEDGSLYVSWTPWQPDETLTRWSSHLQCQHPEFCDDVYALDETTSISKLIYDHQHPSDCSRAKFLIIEREWHSGLGSTIHIKAYSLLVALMSGRVLIDAPGIKWSMTFAASCESEDWACYFAPLTNCTVPKDWKSTAAPFTSIAAQSDARYTFSSAQMNLADVPGIGNVQITDLFGSPTFNHKPASWWMTQATGYVARPNDRTLRAVCYIWSCIFGAKQQPPRPFAAMFIRRGDKLWEARLREPFEYFNLLEGLDRNLSEPIKSVYVGTDDPTMLSQITREYSIDWDLVWMGYPRSSQGSQHDEEIARYHTAKIELQVLLTLAEVFISASADVLVGTLSSNQCRLMDELRKLQGKGRTPYLSPEGQLIAGQR